MASWFIERNDTRRPCIEKRTNKKCLFHRWFDVTLNDGERRLAAVLEFEDGNVKLVSHERFRFVDGGQFLQWHFNCEEKEDSNE